MKLIKKAEAFFAGLLLGYREGRDSIPYEKGRSSRDDEIEKLRRENVILRAEIKTAWDAHEEAIRDLRRTGVLLESAERKLGRMK